MLCKFSLRARMTIYGAHAYDCLVLGCLFIFICNALDLEVTCLDSSMQCPSIHPYAYRAHILLFFATVTIAHVSLLLLLCCCYYKLLLLINFCEQELFPGAAELTTQLLRLASIIWLPLCQINKMGNTTREDCCGPLHLWAIKTIFWRCCQGA